jgi:large subunit ribosomal protein L14
MKAIRARIPKSLGRGARIETCDNSGAKIVYLISVKGSKTVKGRYPAAGIGDLVMVSVIKGNKEMRKQVVPAIIVRQKKEFRRLDGTRVKFEDNAVVVCKDEKGNPKGTIFKGPIAKEAAERWVPLAKVASIMV